MNPNLKEFKKLQQKWYKQLQSAGFEDIEQDDRNFKKNSHLDFKIRYSDVEFEQRQNYYRLAGFFLNDYAFTNLRERLIWKLHAEGLSIRKIDVILKQQKFHSNTKQLCQQVRNLKKKMIEMYKVQD